MTKKIFLIVPGILVWMASFSQPSSHLTELQEWLRTNKPTSYDSSLAYPMYLKKGLLNYFTPLYQLLGEEKKYQQLLGVSNYYDHLSQAASFVDDYESALWYQKKNYDTIDQYARRNIERSINSLQNVQNVEARKFIIFISRNYRVIMINEAHNNPLHRAFTASMLEDLYKRGFHYLAMEMLSNYSDTSRTPVTSVTGHYSSEPVAGELIRKAADIGFRLVGYEDPEAQTHTPTQRDSVQAANLFKIIQQDPDARILVHAGYGHIAEKSDSSDFVPMGMAFKKISGIDPLTIDQTNMTEESTFAYGKALYEAYVQKYDLAYPSIALVNDEPVNVTNNDIYDLSVIHPRTIYRDGRPVWLNMFGLRQALYVKPSDKNTFLVQAYYQYESFSHTPGQLVPADQTYIPTNKGNYLLYLRRGKYILLFRDKNYKVLNTQHIEVN